MKELKIGIAGVVGRGKIYVKHYLDEPNIKITAICDLKEEGMQEYKDKIGDGVKTFTDYNQMIHSGLISAVVIATPIPCHVQQAIYALNHNVHVLSEVPSASSVEECRQLYEAVKSSKAQYMLAENVNYYKNVIVIENIIKSGLLGEIHYAEGQYLHYLEELNEWRINTLDGCSYCTHSLGPILKWFGDNDTLDRICCIGSGKKRVYNGKELHREISNVMLGKMKSGKLFQIRTDFDTPTPYTLTFEVCGTKGKARIRSNAPDVSEIHIENYEYGIEEWKSLEYYEKEFLPKDWFTLVKNVENISHEIGDCVVAKEFVKAIIQNQKVPISFDMAMNMTLPGILSSESIKQGGKWVSIPDLKA